jgi:Restriction endonuclease
MAGTLDPKEKEFLAETQRLSKKAFYGATPLSRNDTRWHLIQAQAERAVPRTIFDDECRSSLVGDQLVMYIPQSLLGSVRLPDGAIFYLWANVFHPITTLSFFWDSNKATKSYRGYFLSDGPEVDRAKRAPIILAFVADNRSEALQSFEIDLRPLTCLSQGSTPELRYVGDVEAARLYVMNALNKPRSDSAPELWLRDGYITRLYREVEEGILCIAENQLVETIPEEEERLKVQGLECYGSFPYQREVYAYCKELLAKKYDHFLCPFFDVAECATKAEAPRLRYQLQQFMTCALYSVAMTCNGTCLPSYDGEGNLDIVELDSILLRSRASVFWQNLPWSVTHYYRDAVGIGNFPANQLDFYRQVPLWHGEIREGKELAEQLMAEAFALKSAIIPPGAYHPIDGGGCLAAVRLREFEKEVMATFCDPAGGFIQASMCPADGVWRIHTHPSGAAKKEIHDRFEKAGVFAGTTTGQGHSEIWDEVDLFIERLEIGIGVFLAALIRDFWVVEHREKVFSDKLQTKKVRRLHADRFEPVTIYLPRVRYVNDLNDRARNHLSSKTRKPHQVNEHLRRCGNADPAQIALAKEIGFSVPKGYTFVKRHCRGEGQIERHYRSLSALQLLGTPPPGDSKRFKDDWLEFERNTAHWLQSQGWEIEQWGASRRGDRGVDIVASKQGRVALVQCKYWAPNMVIGPHIVRELIGARSSIGGQIEAVIVTSSRLTEEAKRLASETGVKWFENVDYLLPAALPTLK